MQINRKFYSWYSIIIVFASISAGTIVNYFLIHINDDIMIDKTAYLELNINRCRFLKPVSNYLDQSHDDVNYDFVSTLAIHGFGYRSWKINAYDVISENPKNGDYILKKSTFITQNGWPFLSTTTISVHTGLNIKKYQY